MRIDIDIYQKKCWDFDSSPAVFKRTLDSLGFLFEFGWKILLVGYEFGFIVGVIIGNIATSRKVESLLNDAKQKN